jgi:CheY-like chemotaxis protein
MNLVSNGVKFTDHGEVGVSLRVNGSSKLVVEVTDTGIGLSETDQKRLFSAFVQSDTGRGGAGLGLLLAKTASQQLGGDVELVSSRLGKGSRFRANLDIGQTNDRSLQSSPPKSARSLEGISVLFAEDNDDILDGLSMMLESFGCSVEKAHDGLEAVRRGLSRPFDVVLMDVRMPVLDGLEATRRLRRNGYKGPILALSAHAMKEDRERFLAAGCTDHITKPIDINKLVVRLAAFRFVN